MSIVGDPTGPGTTRDIGYVASGQEVAQRLQFACSNLKIIQNNSKALTNQTKSFKITQQNFNGGGDLFPVLEGPARRTSSAGRVRSGMERRTGRSTTRTRAQAIEYQG